MSYPEIHNGIAKSIGNLAGAFTVGVRHYNGKLFATMRAPVHGDHGFRLKATTVSGG